MRTSSLATALFLALVLALHAASCADAGDDDDDDTGEGEGEGEEGEGEPGEGEGEGEGEGACGDDVVDGAAITDTEGLVVARDGAVYFSQPEFVGRRDVDGTIDGTFAALGPGADPVWGVMLSPDNATLYAASAFESLVYVIDAATGAVRFTIDAGGVNGLTIDDEGTLFASDFFNDVVLRIEVGADEASTAVSTVTSAVTSPNGVLVDGDDVLVLSYASGELVRAVGGRVGEATDAQVIAEGLGNPDGIVRAQDGSFFVTDNGAGEVLHVEGGVGTVVAADLPGAANLDFGAGALRCDRLLVTSFEGLGVLDVSATGAPVPWR